MSEKKQFFRLVHSTARQMASRACINAPDGYLVEISEPSKTRDQEAKYHCMFSDVAKQIPFMGEMRDMETWKRLLVDAFARAKAAEGKPIQGMGSIIPNLDGNGFVQLGVQTKRFKKSEASEFVEFVYAWGAEHEITWSERAQKGYDEIRGGS